MEEGTSKEGAGTAPQRPRISVIISTFNRPDRLRKAVESVKHQTFTEWELIVVYDGHPINPDIVAHRIYKDLAAEGGKVRFVCLDARFGNDTRPKNRGIKEAKADLIAFLDDDNEWRPDHLQALYNAQLDTGADVVYGDRFIIDETGQVPPQLGIHSEPNSALLMQRNYIDTSDALVKKSALEYVGGFDERYKKYVDWNLWVRLDKARFSFIHVPLVLTDYHIHKDAKSMRPEDEKAVNVPAWDPIECEVRVRFLGPVAPPKVAIFSLVYDRPELMETCFESLYKTADYPFDHVVVAQTPADAGLVNAFWEHHEAPGNATLIKNQANVGISKGSNQAVDEITKGTYDIIIKVDPDCLFLTDGWLKKMVEIWGKNHRLALSCYVQGLRDNPGGSPRLVYGTIAGTQIGMVKHLGGICCFASAKAYDGFRWDENDFLHGMQDTEFSQHLKFAGFQMGYLENYFVSHGPDGTAGQIKAYPDYFERRKLEKQTRYEANTDSKSE